MAWVLCIIFLFPLPASAHTATRKNKKHNFINHQLWKGLVAEDASGESMYAIACVVRNRLNKNMGHGLCGLKRRNLDQFVRKQGRKAEHLAKKTVDQVFRQRLSDCTRGATHYEEVERYGLPYWAAGMQRTCKIGVHTFFR